MTTSPNDTFSRFGGLWTDRSDAPAELERRVAADLLSPAEADTIRSWMANGYVILKGAIPPESCAAFSDELARMWREGAPDALMQEPGEPKGVPITVGSSPVMMRVLDIHAVRSAALELLFAPPIVRFLQLIFERDPLLFQSLTFECGSEQGIHQDTAYVVVHPPLELAAAWIALEDVTEGSGELQYYEGSHRLPEYLFSGQHKHFNRGRDGAEQHSEWEGLLHINGREMNLPLKTFLPKQGDVLIWAADLAHGGAQVKDRTLTRRSLVGHYCPIGALPNYYTYRDDRSTAVSTVGGAYSSEYYDLRPARRRPRFRRSKRGT